MRAYLHTFVHEAGHAFNMAHSWEKKPPRADSLSWMNYFEKVVDFWQDFMFRFDDEELIHIRHGDRNSVIMGADPFSSGGYLGTPAGVIPPVEGSSPLEFLVRSKSYYDFLEPIQIELRLKNLTTIPILVNTRLRPGDGFVRVFVKQPDGMIFEYKPIIYKVGTNIPILLQSTNSDPLGTDRYSQSIFLSIWKEVGLLSKVVNTKFKLYMKGWIGLFLPIS